MKIKKLILGVILLGLLPACTPVKKDNGFDYSNVYKEQYPVAISQDYITSNSSLDRQGVSYGGGSVTVYPLDANITTQPIQQAGSNYSYSQYDNLAPIGSYSYNNGSSYTYLDDNTIYFKHGSATLGSGDKNRIEELANMLKSTGKTAKIIGHASKAVYTTNDPIQQDIVNLHMSAKRAMAVTEQLYKKGVLPEQLETISLGDANSLGDDSKDRRVDMIME